MDVEGATNAGWRLVHAGAGKTRHGMDGLAVAGWGTRRRSLAAMVVVAPLAVVVNCKLTATHP